MKIVIKRIKTHERTIGLNLHDILKNSPYTNLFKSEEFIEIDENISKMLNMDWSMAPHLKYVCSAMLAGMVVIKWNKAQLQRSI
jgi:hypothetical protein